MGTQEQEQGQGRPVVETINNGPLRLLSFEEQNAFHSRLFRFAEQCPLQDNIYFTHGGKLAGCVSAAVAFISLRCATRAFSLSKFNRGRVTTLVMAAIGATYGSINHNSFVRSRVTEPNRRESALYYGVKSLLVHQYSVFTIFLLGVMFPFLTAQGHNIVAIPNDFVTNKESRRYAAKFIFDKLFIYRRILVPTYVVSSIMMFVIGSKQYTQSVALVDKMIALKVPEHRRAEILSRRRLPDDIARQIRE